MGAGAASHGFWQSAAQRIHFTAARAGALTWKEKLASSSRSRNFMASWRSESTAYMATLRLGWQPTCSGAVEGRGDQQMVVLTGQV